MFVGVGKRSIFHQNIYVKLTLFANNKYCLILRISIKIDNLVPLNIKTRKMFSEKTIVEFTNNTVFILDFYVYD